MALRGFANQFNASASTSAVISVGSIGIAANDYVILFINGGGAGNNTYTFPSGFNAIGSLTNINVNAGYCTLGVAAKIAGGSEPSTYTISSSSNDFQTAHCRVYSGRNTSSPVTAVAQTASSTPANFPISVSMTGLTAAASDDVVLLLGCTGNGSGATETQSLTGPTGFAHQGAGDAQVQFSGPIAYADYCNNPGGATGTLSATWSSSLNGNGLAYGGYLISLAAALGTVINTSVGTATLSGNAPSLTRAVNSVLTPAVAQRKVWMPDRKIFLPSFRKPWRKAA